MPQIDDLTLEKELREMTALIAEIDPKEIGLESRFVEDLGMDSMMALEILASIEKKYELKIPEENLTKITNLNKVIELVDKFLSR